MSLLSLANMRLLQLVFSVLQASKSKCTYSICIIKIQSSTVFTDLFFNNEGIMLLFCRAQDQATMQLSEMEEEMDQRIQAAERKTREQVGLPKMIPTVYHGREYLRHTADEVLSVTLEETCTFSTFSSLHADEGNLTHRQLVWASILGRRGGKNTGLYFEFGL